MIDCEVIISEQTTNIVVATTSQSNELNLHMSHTNITQIAGYQTTKYHTTFLIVPIKLKFQIAIIVLDSAMVAQETFAIFLSNAQSSLLNCYSISRMKSIDCHYLQYRASNRDHIFSCKKAPASYLASIIAAQHLVLTEHFLFFSFLFSLLRNRNMCAITAVLQIAICYKLKKCIKSVSFNFTTPLRTPR